MINKKINKKIKKQFPTNRGVAIFVAILIAGFALAIGMSVLSITLKEIKLSSLGRESAEAFFAADTGLECALKWEFQPPSPGQSIFGYYSSAVAPVAGLTGWWRLDESMGSIIAIDWSSKGNIGNLRNMSGNEWTIGQVDGALSFDGIDDYVDIDNATTAIANDTTGTVSFWAKIAQDDNLINAVFTVSSASGLSFSYFSVVYDMRSGKDYLKALLVTDSVTQWEVNTPVDSLDLYVGQWINIILVQNGTEPKIYFNGVLQAIIFTGFTDKTKWMKSIITDATKKADSISMGLIRIVDTIAGQFEGNIDDVRIYDTALTAGQVSDLYNATAMTFTNPVLENNGQVCLGEDITNPNSGWKATGWVDSPSPSENASITFDIGPVAGPCAEVTVTKEFGKTTIKSRGYNNCDPTSSRRVERGIKVGAF